MTNFTASSSSRTTFIPAFALALVTIVNAPTFPEAAPEAIKGFEPSMTTSSYSGTINFSTTPAPASFEERLSSFYSTLAASQVSLDQDIQQILASNVSSLYED